MTFFISSRGVHSPNSAPFLPHCNKKMPRKTVFRRPGGAPAAPAAAGYAYATTITTTTTTTTTTTVVVVVFCCCFLGCDDCMKDYSEHYQICFIKGTADSGAEFHKFAHLCCCCCSGWQSDVTWRGPQRTSAASAPTALTLRMTSSLCVGFHTLPETWI